MHFLFSFIYVLVHSTTEWYTLWNVVSKPVIVYKCLYMLCKAWIILSCILCFSSRAFKLGKGGEIELCGWMGIQRRNRMSYGEKREENISLSSSQLSPLSSVLGGSWLCLTFCWSGMELSPALLWRGWRWWPCVAVKPGTWFTHTQKHTDTQVQTSVSVCLIH